MADVTPTMLAEAVTAEAQDRYSSYARAWMQAMQGWASVWTQESELLRSTMTRASEDWAATTGAGRPDLGAATMARHWTDFARVRCEFLLKEHRRINDEFLSTMFQCAGNVADALDGTGAVFKANAEAANPFKQAA